MQTDKIKIYSMANPTGLRYEYSTNTVMHPPKHIFEFYSEDKNKQGELSCHRHELPIRPNYGGPVLVIDYIEVTEKNKGLGTKILKFAEEFSRQLGCSGFISLISDGTGPERMPHIFYRKYGFSTFDKKTDKKLDEFIKQNKNATREDFTSWLYMHYPAKPKLTLKTWLLHLRNLLK